MFFCACGDLKRLFENLAFPRLLAKQTLQLFYLVLEGAIFGRRDNILVGSRGRHSAWSGDLRFVSALLEGLQALREAAQRYGVILVVQDRRLQLQVRIVSALQRYF